MTAIRHSRRLGLWAALALILIGLCGARYLRPDSAKQSLTVLAASSLTEAFSALAKDFEERNPDTQVELVFAGSQVLRMQVQAGAPGDVIASAHPEHLVALEQSGHAKPALDLARNRLALIVREDQAARDWKQVVGLPRWILGSAQVPIGRYTQALFRRMAQEIEPQRIADLQHRVLSHEPNVRMVRAKVQMGQADAAVVYASDVRPGLGIQEVPLPASLGVEVDYHIATLRGGALAERFVAYARSKAGQATLARAGLLPRVEAP